MMLVFSLTWIHVGAPMRPQVGGIYRLTVGPHLVHGQAHLDVSTHSAELTLLTRPHLESHREEHLLTSYILLRHMHNQRTIYHT